MTRPAKDERSNANTARFLWPVSGIAALCLHLIGAVLILSTHRPTPAVSPPSGAIMVEVAPLQTSPLPAPPSETKDFEKNDQLDEVKEEPQLITEQEEPPIPPMPDTRVLDISDAEIAERQDEAKTSSTDYEPVPTRVIDQSTESDAVAAPKSGVPSVANPEITLTWQAAVLGKLETFKRYPRRAERRRQEGVVYIRIVIDRTGMVLDGRIERSSGYAVLDNEALSMVDRASPLPPPPLQVGGETIEILVPIEFFVRN